MHTDLQLLTRYHQRGDAIAFRDLMQAHASMVFATAKRITGNAAVAEDVAQETFLQLARHGQQITESVAAWLHRVAARRACNAIRDDATRRRYEDAAAQVVASSGAEASWAEVEAVLDTVIEELPDHLRGPLVMHFLQGRSQRDIAKEMRVSQSTVSRAVETGLAELRTQLRGKGLYCGAGLGVMIAAQAASAASVPPVLMASLAKLGMSGIGGAVPAVSSALPLALKVCSASIAAVVLGVLGVNLTHPRSSVSHSANAPAPLQQGPGAETAIVPDVAEAASNRPPPPAKAAMVPVPPAADPAAMTGAPVHELVHSFPTPPQHPSGHMVRDAEGWIWGTTGSGGHYGLGTIYKMRADGSEWQEMASFNGIQGFPRGSSPRGGLTRASDGSLWGTTAGGGARDQGTLFRFDPRTAQLATRVEFQNVGSPWGRPTIAPDGQIWGTTYNSVYRFNPATGQLVTVFRPRMTDVKRTGRWIQGELVPDGRGFLWGTASAGSEEANRGRLWNTSPGDNRLGHGMVFKIELATGAAATVVEFTGKSGPFIGSAPRCGLTKDADGFLWGTTYRGGSKDGGTVFKIHAESGAFSHVAEFKVQDGNNPGMNPETVLVADGAGNFWGTTSYGGKYGRGAVFKLNVPTGKLMSVVTFTGIEGAAPGGPARGDLFSDGTGGFIGACDFGGAGWVGTIYRVDIHTGQYTLLKDISDLARTTEGTQPHGRLTPGADGWLWGVTNLAGAHHCGTIYKFNPLTNALATVVDFTGTKGPHKGRFAREGLVSDGRGWLWGTTPAGGSADRGTVYKVNETTGEFVTAAEFGTNIKDGMGWSPRSELVADGKGSLWGATSSVVFKVDIGTHAIVAIARFTGDRGPNYGSNAPGTMAMDDRGFLWGAVLADHTHKCASLFKIDTATNAFTRVAAFTDANQGWEGWHPEGHMHWDGKGSMWFAGVIDNGGRNAKCALVRVNTRTNAIEGRYDQPGGRTGTFAAFGTPTMDEHGVLWGSYLQPKFGGIYTFDTTTGKFAHFLEFSGQGSQARSGYQPQVTRFLKHIDGNFYAVTRYAGPGNGGTVFRLRFGPTPMTQHATLLTDGRVALHGTLNPNGLDSKAAFEWGTDTALSAPSIADAGHVSAADAIKPVTSILSGLQAGTTYYFRLRGTNAGNRLPQRGAILSFTMPAAEADNAASLVAAAGRKRGAVQGGSGGPVTASASRRYALRINRIPGAGAGFVTGALSGAAYEIGKRYALTALADNGYVFHHWSGPGITGTEAESPQLSFIFTEALAKSPVINATFVRDQFPDDAVGLFTGLVLAAEGVAPDLATTGGLRVNVSARGTFSGTLRYDGDIILFAGLFDTAGLARFGSMRLSPWVVSPQGKPVLLLSLQLDSSAAGPPGLHGTITSANGTNMVVRSVITAARSYYNGRDRAVPASFLTADGYHDLTMAGAGAAEAGALMHLTAAGNVTFATRLADGTAVLAHASLSQANQAAIFSQLYLGHSGSLGGLITLDQLFQPQADDANAQPSFWWCRPGQPWLELMLRPSTAAAGQ